MFEHEPHVLFALPTAGRLGGSFVHANLSDGAHLVVALRAGLKKFHGRPAAFDRREAARIGQQDSPTKRENVAEKIA